MWQEDIPLSVQERKLAVMPSFQEKGGIFTMGGRWDGKDCAVSSSNINGKVSMLMIL